MDTLRLDAVAARVVAWHNRHPLALRITAAQVHSVGYVALPFAATGEAPPAPPPADAGSLRERAMARARQDAAGAAPATAVAAPAVPVPAAANPPQAVFSEDFIAPLQPRDVARWAARHGCRLPHAPADGPVRQVLAGPAPPGTVPVMLYVLTAAVGSRGRSRRVLLGAGPQADVLGRRLWNPLRAAALAALPMVLLCAGLWVALRGAAPMPAAPAAAASAAAASGATAASPSGRQADEPAAQAMATATATATAPAASSGDRHPTEPTAPAASMAAATPTATPTPVATPTTTATATPSSAPAPRSNGPSAGHSPARGHDGKRADTSDHGPQVGAANSPAPAASEIPPTAAPPNAEPRLGRVDLPAIVPRSSDQATGAGRRGRAQAAEPAPASALAAVASATAGGPSVPGTAATTAPPGTPARASAGAAREQSFAITTRKLRTRAEAEQVMAAMAALLRSPGAGQLHTDILPEGADWRVVGWPFARRNDADLARELLLARGMRVDVVAF